MDIAESGHISKDSSPHSSRTRLPRDTQEGDGGAGGGGGGGDNSSKPVRRRFRTAVTQNMEIMKKLSAGENVMNI